MSEDLLRFAAQLYELHSNAKKDSLVLKQKWEQITEYYNKQKFEEPGEMRTKAQLQMAMKNLNRKAKKNKNWNIRIYFFDMILILMGVILGVAEGVELLVSLLTEILFIQIHW